MIRMTVTRFGHDDITLLTFETSYDNVTDESLYDKLKFIQRGQFLSGNISGEDMIKPLAEILPLLSLTGEGFVIRIQSSSIKLTISTNLAHLPSMPSSGTVDPTVLFAASNLQKLSMDYNSVVGQVLGALGIGHNSTKFIVGITMTKDDTYYKTDDLNEKLNPVLQSFLGESKQIRSSNVEFWADESLLGKQVTAFYKLWDGSQYAANKSSVKFSGSLSFKNTGVQNLDEITCEYINRINSSVEKLTGGLEAIERD